ncbi:MAG: nucleoside triphosphate pyrophosphohydrolase [Planctomycetota bacterium]|nr:nucleoside triphosphate pyrophosphohydrolase [Planctomycetota bacterium]
MSRPFETPPPTGDERVDALARLVAIVDRLRAPDGCPWDREQTVDSMAPSLVEEAHELVEAIESGTDEGTVEEAGDLLMVVVLICRIAQDEGRFDLADAVGAVGDKLIRRHPHVFGGVDVALDAKGAAHAIANWERIKSEERRSKNADASALAGVPKALPALQRVQRIGAKAIAAGFRWADAEGALKKLEEEVAELREAFDAGDEDRVAAELGDVLLAGAFLGTYLEIDPERVTRESLRRFESRFREMEGILGDRLRDAPLAELIEAWRRAKARVT